jgi:hypothetical protein
MDWRFSEAFPRQIGMFRGGSLMAFVAGRHWVGGLDNQDFVSTQPETDSSRDAAKGIMFAVMLGLATWGIIGAGLWVIF